MVSVFGIGRLKSHFLHPKTAIFSDFDFDFFPLLSSVSISNCRYQEAPGEVVWSDILAQLPRRSIEIL